MAWRLGSSGAVLALALLGCGTFVQAESATEGDDGSSGTGGTTNATVSPSTSGSTDSASGGPGSTPSTSNSDTSGTDPTGTSDTEPSKSDTDTSTGFEPSASGTSTTGSDTEETATQDVGSTGPLVCDEADIEPNGDPVNGVTQPLPNQFCGAPASTVSGTLLDGSDLDAFVYLGVWNCGDSNNPNHRVEVEGPVTACIFPLCPNDITTETNCIAGTSTTVNGVQGCCSDDTAIADVNCVVFGGDESATGFILVESDAAECTDYTVTYAVDDA
ncbi:MAG: hypothetical protein KUG77_20345 [Nannocystaceae bacterium]|nr:hypothetical protein [Nannocystaceae bacterium]